MDHPITVSSVTLRGKVPILILTTVYCNNILQYWTTKYTVKYNIQYCRYVKAMERYRKRIVFVYV